MLNMKDFLFEDVFKNVIPQGTYILKGALEENNNAKHFFLKEKIKGIQSIGSSLESQMYGIH